MNLQPNTNMSLGVVVTPADENSSGSYPIALKRSFNAGNQPSLTQVLTGSVYVGKNVSSSHIFGIHMTSGQVISPGVYSDNNTTLAVQGGFEPLAGGAGYQSTNPDGREVRSMSISGLAVYNDTGVTMGIQFSPNFDQSVKPVMLLRPGGQVTMDNPLYTGTSGVRYGISGGGGGSSGLPFIPLADANYMLVFPYQDGSAQKYNATYLVSPFRNNYVKIMKTGYGVDYQR